jgi:hypothetical protein
MPRLGTGGKGTTGVGRKRVNKEAFAPERAALFAACSEQTSQLDETH